MSLIQVVYKFKKLLRHVKKLTKKCTHLKNAIYNMNISIYIPEFPYHQ